MKWIDVSSNQGNINFLKVLNDGVGGVIIRTILKSGAVDQKAAEYFAGAQAVGIKTDAYKYSYALSQEEEKVAFERVISFLRASGVDPAQTTVWGDYEWSTQRQKLSRQEITDLVKVARDVIEGAGYKFGVYCNLDWYKNVLLPEQLPVTWWIARYPANDDGTIHENLRPNVGEMIWQYSSKGKVDGISGYVDMDDRNEEVAYYPLPQIQQLFQVSGMPWTYPERKNIAHKNGLMDYTGTEQENMYLFGLWAQGKLVVP